jgi:hypothetical protein
MIEESSCDEIWYVDSMITIVESASGSRTEQVVLCQTCPANTLLLSVNRSNDSIVSKANWDTLQVGMNEHARFGKKALKLNHAQNPNTRIHIVSSNITGGNNIIKTQAERVEVISAKEIPANEALSFNYNTTEFLMAEPFVDWVTGLQVGGFSVASNDEQKFLLDSDLVTPHVRLMAGK